MSTKADALAQVYARSLFELAEEAGGRSKILEVGEELEQICELARGDRPVREFFRSPIIDKAKRGDTLGRIFHGRVTDLTLRFLLVLNNKGRLGHLEPICDAYDLLVHEAFGRVEVDLYTPEPMRKPQLASIKERLAEALGKEPVLYAYSDPAMIGGIKLRVGDQLIDGSVASRLRRIKLGLPAAGGAAVRNRLGRFIEEGGESS